MNENLPVFLFTDVGLWLSTVVYSIRPVGKMVIFLIWDQVLTMNITYCPLLTMVNDS